MQTTRVVIDCDPGIDDVVALALALRSPELHVVAITTTYGNATLELTTRNTRTLLGLASRTDVAVVPGADRPLHRALVTAPETHGETGVGYAAVEPAEPMEPRPDALATVLAQSGPVVLVTLGPLTNLAHALARDPAMVKHQVVKHVGMFGNLHERGNTNRWADFNAWCDPEATHAVLAADLPTAMVGLDVTRRMTMDATEVDALEQRADPLVQWLGQALRFYVEFHRSEERLDGCVVNDVLPIGELIHPGLLGFERVALAVDLDAGAHRGHTREQAGGSTTPVALRVDVPRIRLLLDRVFGAGWQLR